jgi:pimeloyl-ACP methyl ester carboxylesterase
MGSLPNELRHWRNRGSLCAVFGHDVFVVDEGEREAEPLLLLHGYPSSSYDFVDVLTAFARRFRVVAHDHVGFGLSAKPKDYSYSLIEQADAALGLWRELGIEGGHILAHDYGTSVATELLARRERGLLDFDIRSVTLCNGSMHVEMADMSLLQWLLPVKRIGPVLAQLASRKMFHAQIRRILGDGGSVSDRQIDLMWDGIEHNDGRERIHQIARYQYEREKYWHRWIGALQSLDLACHVLWGRQDAVAVAEMAETLHDELPSSRLTWMNEPLAKNEHWKDQLAQLSERTTPPIDQEVENPEQGKEASLALRAQRRAYAGAPPVVPHPVKQRGDLACLACHGDGLTIKGKLAPPMSHEKMVNCTQCHVSSGAPVPGVAEQDYDLSTENAFDGLPEPRNGEQAWAGAPPTMPHSSQMREDCNSCHGPNGREGLRTSHPWRQNCVQCHTPSGELDQRAPLIDRLPPIER